MRPALFLLMLLMPLALLAGCRQLGKQENWHYLEGTALGTGYHLTLNGYLDAEALALIEDAIHGELERLEAELKTLQTPWAGDATAIVEPSSAAPEALRQALQARALDRVTLILIEYGVNNALVEVGGDLRALGMAGRYPWRVRLPRSGFDAEHSAILRLDNAALVTRSAAPPATAAGMGGASTTDTRGAAVNLPDGRVVSVTAVDDSAVAADRLAHAWLNMAPSGSAPEQLVQLVVLTPWGATLHLGNGLERLLEP